MNDKTKPKPDYEALRGKLQINFDEAIKRLKEKNAKDAVEYDKREALVKKYTAMKPVSISDPKPKWEQYVHSLDSCSERIGCCPYCGRCMGSDHWPCSSYVSMKNNYNDALIAWGDRQVRILEGFTG